MVWTMGKFPPLSAGDSILDNLIPRRIPRALLSGKLQIVRESFCHLSSV